MDFDLDKAQQLLQQSTREFFVRECKPEKVRALMATETAYDDALWQGIADQGWTGLLIPEEFAGLGLTTVELAVVAEEMGRACLPAPYLSTVWAAMLIDRAGSDGQRAQYLEKIALGEIKATVAQLEESADWHPASIEMRAEKDGNTYRLNGRKEFVTDAAVADLIIVVARNDNGLVLLPIAKGASGVTITATPGIDATRKLYAIDFANVVVAETDALVSGLKAEQALEAATDVAAIALCAELVGGMQWTLEAAVEYAKTRLQFGKPIGIYQAVQHRCADMFLWTESARSATYNAAWALSVNDPSAQLAVAMAKAYASDAGRDVGNNGIQVHGGIGFTWEHNLHLYYKRAKGGEIMFGDASHHRERIAQMVVDEDEG